MHEPVVNVFLDGNRRLYEPGETLAGEYRVESLSTAEPVAVEVSVLWYTEGQGDEDFAVHYFDRQTSANGQAVDLTQPRRYSTQLPASPLSYEGVIVKIRWCVRVRLFLPRGKDVVQEQPFQLGHVPPARPVEHQADA